MQIETAVAYFTIKAARNIFPDHDKYYLQTIDVLAKYKNQNFNIENSSISVLTKTSNIDTENQVENTLLNLCNDITEKISKAKKCRDFKSENIVEKCETLSLIQKNINDLAKLEEETHSILLLQRDFLVEMGVSSDTFSALTTQYNKISYINNDLEEIIAEKIMEPLDKQILEELKKIEKIEDSKEKLKKSMKLLKASAILQDFSKLYKVSGKIDKIVRIKEIEKNSKDAKSQIDQQLEAYQNEKTKEQSKDKEEKTEIFTQN